MPGITQTERDNMSFVLLTVAFYTISSLGDKYISHSLKTTPGEFTFIVSFFTAIWLGITIPFAGCFFAINTKNIFAMICLMGLKILEFYTSALLLREVSPYELKTWLGINIIISYIIGIIKHKYVFVPQVIIFGIVLLFGIYEIIRGKKNILRQMGLYIGFIMSKLLYGIVIGKISGECSINITLFIIMSAIALMHIRHIKIKKLKNKIEVTKGAALAGLTRIPNAAGLYTEAIAAGESIYLYGMVQPLQLAILFVTSLIKKEKMSKRKFIGSILCIVAVAGITLCIK